KIIFLSLTLLSFLPHGMVYNLTISNLIDIWACKSKACIDKKIAQHGLVLTEENRLSSSPVGPKDLVVLSYSDDRRNSLIISIKQKTGQPVINSINLQSESKEGFDDLIAELQNLGYLKASEQPYQQDHTAPKSRTGTVMVFRNNSKPRIPESGQITVKETKGDGQLRYEVHIM
ncbi:MAG: hypothetical protein AAFR14_12840, partial [Bacteroidota bacterium]